MKKSVLIILVVLLCMFGFTLYKNIKKEKIDEPISTDPVDLSNNINTVDIIDGFALSDIIYNDIVISNISISNGDEKSIYFQIESEETNLNDLSLTLVLLNPEVENSANRKTINLKKDGADNNLRTMIMDISSIYNNPVSIKFIFE